MLFCGHAFTSARTSATRTGVLLERLRSEICTSTAAHSRYNREGQPRAAHVHPCTARRCKLTVQMDSRTSFTLPSALHESVHRVRQPPALNKQQLATSVVQHCYQVSKQRAERTTALYTHRSNRTTAVRTTRACRRANVACNSRAHFRAITPVPNLESAHLQHNPVATGIDSRVKLTRIPPQHGARSCKLTVQMACRMSFTLPTVLQQSMHIARQRQAQPACPEQTAAHT